MIIGKVVGTVVSTRKNEALTGSKFLVIDPIEHMTDVVGSRIVAIDSIGAGIGELVIVSTGSAARCQTGLSGDLTAPVDAAVVGIVDDPSKIVLG